MRWRGGRPGRNRVILDAASRRIPGAAGRPSRAGESENRMKTQLTDVNPTRKRLEVEVPASDVQSVVDELLREFRRTAKIPGFRPGKAPLEVVRKKMGAGLGREAAERILDRFAREALSREDVRPVEGSIRVDLDEEGELRPVVEGDPYRFTLEIDVLPEIEPRDYEGLQVARPAVELDEERVGAEMERIRQSRARLVEVGDRPSRKGDVVLVELEVVGEDGEVLMEPRVQTIALGDENNIPAFDEHLTGRREGDQVSFQVSYPEDYPAEQLAGKTVTMRGTVRMVREQQVPEWTDELAREVAGEGEGVETVADLREKVREAIRAHLEAEADRTARRRMLDMILERNPVPVPETLVEREVRARLEEIGRDLAARGLDPKEVDVDWEEVIRQQRQESEKAVREVLLLEAIARREGLRVEPAEVERELELLARREGADPAELRRRLEERGMMEVLEKQLLRSKCVDWLYQRSHIV